MMPLGIVDVLDAVEVGRALLARHDPRADADAAVGDDVADGRPADPAADERDHDQPITVTSENHHAAGLAAAGMQPTQIAIGISEIRIHLT